MGRSSSKRGSKVFLFVFGIPFASVGAFMLYLSIQTIHQSHLASRWSEEACEIISADLNVNSGSDSTTYKCVARYRYTVHGKGYTSDRVSFSKGSDNIGSFHRDCYNAIQSQSKQNAMVCYVDPDNPYEAILFRGVRWGMIGFYMIFVLTFGGVGLGVMAAGLFGSRKEKKVAASRLQYPDQPWMWRPEWQAGVINASDKVGMYAISGFALFWNVIAFPIGIMAFTDGYLKDGNKGALIALLFPFVGVLLIAGALYAILKYRKYGAVSLQLAAVPGVLGGKLAGIIRVPVNIVAEDGFHLKLQCIHRYVTGSGKHRSTHKDVLWEDSCILADEMLAGDHSQTALPILFGIPYAEQESSPEVGNDGMSLLAHLAEGPARVVIADCAVMGADPGDWRIMHPSELLSRKVTGRISTHDGDVMKVLAAAERLGYSLDNVMIFGIEPESTDLEIAISKSLSDRIAEYAIAAGEALAA